MTFKQAKCKVARARKNLEQIYKISRDVALWNLMDGPPHKFDIDSLYAVQDTATHMIDRVKKLEESTR